METVNGDCEWRLGMETGNGDWEWRLGMETGNGDWEWSLEMRLTLPKVLHCTDGGQNSCLWFTSEGCQFLSFCQALVYKYKRHRKHK